MDFKSKLTQMPDKDLLRVETGIQYRKLAPSRGKVSIIVLPNYFSSWIFNLINLFIALY